MIEDLKNLDLKKSDFNRNCHAFQSAVNNTNNIDINLFPVVQLKNGIYTLDDGKIKFNISKDGYYCYNYTNPDDKKIYNIIFKFYKIDKEVYEIQNFKDYEFNINNYINNDENSFVNKMINDIIRTIYYNFEFILRFSIFGGKIPLLHNVINNKKNSNMEIPIFIQSNFQNAYVLNIDSRVIINIGYYKNNNELISIGAADVLLHELTHAHCDNAFPLDYCAESGAINESLADIFGFVVEYYMGSQNVINLSKEVCDKWTIGDNILDMNNDGKVNLNDSLRSFSNKYVYPSKLQEQPWFIYLYDKKGKMINFDNDCGGVHYNSGILNHYFYKCCITSGIKDIKTNTKNNLVVLISILSIIVRSILSKSTAKFITYKNNITYQQLGLLIKNFINNEPKFKDYKNSIVNNLIFCNLNNNVNIYKKNNDIINWTIAFNKKLLKANKINNDGKKKKVKNIKYCDKPSKKSKKNKKKSNKSKKCKKISSSDLIEAFVDFELNKKKKKCHKSSSNFWGISSSINCNISSKSSSKSSSSSTCKPPLPCPPSPCPPLPCSSSHCKPSSSSHCKSSSSSHYKPSSSSHCKPSSSNFCKSSSSSSSSNFCKPSSSKSSSSNCKPSSSKSSSLNILSSSSSSLNLFSSSSSLSILSSSSHRNCCKTSSSKIRSSSSFFSSGTSNKKESKTIFSSFKHGNKDTSSSSEDKKPHHNHKHKCKKYEDSFYDKLRYIIINILLLTVIIFIIFNKGSSKVSLFRRIFNALYLTNK